MEVNLNNLASQTTTQSAAPQPAARPQSPPPRTAPSPNNNVTIDTPDPARVSNEPLAPLDRNTARPERERPEIEVTDVMINRAIADANRALEPTNFRLSYGVHEATNVITVRVYDAESEEVIRELPPESRLDVLAKIMELSGLMLDNRS